ncbi:MAG TPA: adenylyltransferase/cytidyltransferase family protein, partial [Opitutaceae bacterium]|nr:adenylyltransferase/cytidyltransferase family protein [Opitutaceae bacterium]
MKIGFLGGSFDPVHFGHLGAAQDALAGLSLDRVELVPAAQAPLKEHAPRASAADRLAMLRLAVEDLPGLAVSDHEIARG